jgi:hypothetical protein
MNIQILFTLLSLSFFCSGLPALAQDDFSPQISVESAIKKAQQYAAKNDIDLKGKFITKVEYHNNMHNKSEQPYWFVLWINKRVTKGGGVELRLYADGSIEERYHK